MLKMAHASVVVHCILSFDISVHHVLNPSSAGGHATVFCLKFRFSCTNPWTAVPSFLIFLQNIPVVPVDWTLVSP